MYVFVVHTTASLSRRVVPKLTSDNFDVLPKEVRVGRHDLCLSWSHCTDTDQARAKQNMNLLMTYGGYQNGPAMLISKMLLSSKSRNCPYFLTLPCPYFTLLTYKLYALCPKYCP